MMFHKTTEIAMVQIKTANIAMILHMNARTPLSPNKISSKPYYNLSTNKTHPIGSLHPVLLCPASPHLPQWFTRRFSSRVFVGFILLFRGLPDGLRVLPGSRTSSEPEESSLLSSSLLRFSENQFINNLRIASNIARIGISRAGRRAALRDSQIF